MRWTSPLSSDHYDKEVTTGIWNLSSNTSNRGHSLKLTTQRSRLELRRNSFAVRVVKPWNSLSEEVVTSPSIRMFESRLDKIWNNHISASNGRIWTQWTASYVQHTPMMMMMMMMMMMTIMKPHASFRLVPF